MRVTVTLHKNHTACCVDVKTNLRSRDTLILHRTLDQLLCENISQILIRLDDVSYINTRAIAVLARVAAQLHARGGNLKVSGLTDSLLSVFYRLGASRFIELDTFQPCVPKPLLIGQHARYPP